MISIKIKSIYFYVAVLVFAVLYVYPAHCIAKEIKEEVAVTDSNLTINITIVYDDENKNVKDVLEKYRDNFKKNITLICAAFKKLYSVDFLQLSFYFQDDSGGSAFIGDGDRIVINSGQTLNDIFTLSHEIAHLSIGFVKERECLWCYAAGFDIAEPWADFLAFQIVKYLAGQGVPGLSTDAKKYVRRSVFKENTLSSRYYSFFEKVEMKHGDGAMGDLMKASLKRYKETGKIASAKYLSDYIKHDLNDVDMAQKLLDISMDNLWDIGVRLKWNDGEKKVQFESLVADQFPGGLSPGEKQVNLLTGDFLKSINGKEAKSIEEAKQLFNKAIEKTAPWDKISIEVIREGKPFILSQNWFWFVHDPKERIEYLMRRFSVDIKTVQNDILTVKYRDIPDEFVREWAKVLRASYDAFVNQYEYVPFRHFYFYIEKSRNEKYEDIGAGVCNKLYWALSQDTIDKYAHGIEPVTKEAKVHYSARTGTFFGQNVFYSTGALDIDVGFNLYLITYGILPYLAKDSNFPWASDYPTFEKDGVKFLDAQPMFDDKPYFEVIPEALEYAKLFYQIDQKYGKKLIGKVLQELYPNPQGDDSLCEDFIFKQLDAARMFKDILFKLTNDEGLKQKFEKLVK